MSLPSAILLSAVLIASAIFLSNRWTVIGTETRLWRVDQLTGTVEYCAAGKPPRCSKSP